MNPESARKILSFTRRHNVNLFHVIVNYADLISDRDAEKWSENVASGLMMHSFHESRGLPEPAIPSSTSGTEFPCKEILSFLWSHKQDLYRLITREAEERSIIGPCSWESIAESELTKLGWHKDTESLEALEALEALETE